MNTTNIGNIGYAKTISKFTELNIPVYIPFCEGGIVDLIADFNGKLNKIQVKTTKSVHKDTYMLFKTSHQDGFHGSRKKYSVNEIDYFALYCIENNALLLFPVSECNAYDLKIRLTGKFKIKNRSMKFEENYTFEKFCLS